MGACPVVFVCDSLDRKFPFRSVATFLGAPLFLSSTDDVVDGRLSHALRVAFQPGVCLYVHVFIAAATRSTNSFHLARGTSVVVRAARV